MNGRERLRALRKEIRSKPISFEELKARASGEGRKHLEEVEAQMKGQKPFDAKAWSWSEIPATLRKKDGTLDWDKFLVLTRYERSIE